MPYHTVKRLFISALCLTSVAWLPLVAKGMTFEAGATYQHEVLPYRLSALPASPGRLGLELQITTTEPPVVIAVHPQLSARQAGLQAGDTLLSADGQALQGLTVAAVDAAISDVVGHKVRFVVRRPSQPRALVIVVPVVP
jgi:C-terminal processing protease CtpA/Prc